MQSLKVIVIGVGLALLGCGPAAAPMEPGKTGVVVPAARESQQQIAPAVAEKGQPQAEPAPTATFPPYPTFTPALPGWVKPTEGPTPTPEPTFPPPTEGPDLAVEATTAPEPTISPAKVTEYLRGLYGSSWDGYLARIKVKSHRETQAPSGMTWPADREGWGFTERWRRTKLEVRENYYGAMPQDFEILSWPEFPNGGLEVGMEYILLALAGYVSEGEFPGGWVANLNAEQLRAFGGPAGIAWDTQVWIIEGNRAWRVPDEHFYSLTASSDLAAAKAGGESMAVTDLVAAMKAGLR